MANGDAQFWFHQFFDDDGEPAQGVKVYRYAAGTSTLKDAWVDAGRSTVDENPSLGDSRGMVWFYGDGDYRLRVETSDGVLLYDWDQVRITADTATMWEGNYGTALPGATSVNQGQLFGLVDSTPNLLGAYINTGSAFAGVPGIIPQLAEDDFPAATEAGWLRRRTDNLRGLWHSASGQWVSLSQRTVDVQEFGARGDGATDDTDAFQGALDAIDAAGGGVVNVPRGTYIIGQVTLGSNTWVRGAGAGGTSCKNTSDALTKGIFTNKDQTAGNTRLRISDLTIERSRALTGTAGNFNEFVYFKTSSHIIVDHVRCLGVASANWSDKGIHCENCTSVWITDNHVRGVGDNPITLTGVGLTIDGVVARNLIEWLDNHTGSGIIITGARVIATHNVATQPDATDTPQNMFELGEGVADVVIAQNQIINGGLLIAIEGTSRILIAQNMCTGLANGVTFNNSNAAYPTQADHLITQNVFRGGASISLANTVGRTMTRIKVTDNQLLNGGGIATSGSPTDIVIARNFVYQSNHIGINCGGAAGMKVLDNIVQEAGQDPGVYGLGPQTQSNFYFEGGCGAATTPGLIRGNVAIGSTEYGYYFEQPQFWKFLDNDGWNNTGTTTTPTVKTTDKLLAVNNITLVGAEPFTFVRHVGPDRPGADVGLHAGVGSMWIRNNGNGTTTGGTLYMKYSGTTAAGWLRIELSASEGA